MIYPNNDELNQYPRYILTLLVAERARLLRAGAKPLVPVNSSEFNPLTVALEEIAQGKIKPLIIDENHPRDAVEVLIQGPEHTWQSSTLQELQRRVEEETEEDEEVRAFLESESDLSRLTGLIGVESDDAE